VRIDLGLEAGAGHVAVVLLDAEVEAAVSFSDLNRNLTVKSTNVSFEKRRPCFACASALPPGPRPHGPRAGVVRGPAGEVLPFQSGSHELFPRSRIRTSFHR